MSSSPPYKAVRKIGDYLHCSSTDIHWAISVQSAERGVGNAERMGQILLEGDLITEEQLDSAVKAQYFDRLRECRFLADLTDAELAPIRDISEELNLVAGEDLFKEGQRGDCLYIVVSGCIARFQRQGEAEWTPLGIAHSGAVLGETSYFTNGTRRYSASALKPTVLLRIRYEGLDRLRGSIPALAAGMLEYVTERTRRKEVL